MSDRDRREERIVSAQRRIETHTVGTFERTAVRIPEGLKLWQPKEAATYAIEIIPYDVGVGNPIAKPGEYYYECTYFTHQIPSPTGGEEKNHYCCLQSNWNEPCPVCNYMSKERQKADFNKDLMKSLVRKERQMWLIYDLDHPENGLQFWEYSAHLFGKYLDNKIRTARPADWQAYNLFADPKNGLTVETTAISKAIGRGKPFMEFSSISFLPRRQPVPSKIYDHRICLEDQRIRRSYDDLEALLFGEDRQAERQPERTTVQSGYEGDRPSLQRPGRDDRDDRGDDRDRDQPRNEWREDPHPRREERRDDPPPRREEVRDQPRRDDPPPRRDEAPRRDDRGGDPPPPPAPSVANEVTARQRGISNGDTVNHPKYGDCEVLHISGDDTSIRIRDKNGDIYRAIPPAELTVVRKGAQDRRDDSPPQQRREEVRDDRRDDDQPRRRPRDDDDDEPPRRRRD